MMDKKTVYLDPISKVALRPSLREHWSIIRKRYRHISYILLDLKDYSLINAFYGYKIGDLHLRYVGNILKEFFEDDLEFPNVYRFGSDSFIIVTGVSAGEAYEWLRKVRQHFIIHPFIMPDGSFHFSSFAAVILEIDLFNLDPEEALWIAERALFELKNVSKEGMQIISQEWVKKLKKRRESLKYFIQAVKEDRVTFAMQKIIDLNTGKIFAQEILARIKMEDGKIVPAGIFIEDLSHFGLEMELDEAVIDKALYYKRARNIKECFSLNVSNKFFDQRLNHLVDLVKHYQIDPQEIIIELTEREDFIRISSLDEKFKMLKDAGFSIFLDDFGMGYANFHLVEKYPFDGIKIDGQFIKNMMDNPLDKKFVQFILELGAELGIKMVAEYVESENVINFLKGLCQQDNSICILGQGYAFGRPEIAE
jgi:diguanylate cyclase (GGDEF)-like protein